MPYGNFSRTNNNDNTWTLDWPNLNPTSQGASSNGIVSGSLPWYMQGQSRPVTVGPGVSGSSSVTPINTGRPGAPPPAYVSAPTSGQSFPAGSVNGLISGTLPSYIQEALGLSGSGSGVSSGTQGIRDLDSRYRPTTSAGAIGSGGSDLSGFGGTFQVDGIHGTATMGSGTVSPTISRRNAVALSEQIKTPKQLFLLLVGIFRQTMWQDPYSRAWVGLVPNKKLVGNHVDNRWDFSPVDRAFAAFIDPNGDYASDPAKFRRLLSRHAKQGRQASNIIAAAAEGIGEFWANNIAPTFTGIADALTGLLSIFKMNMLMMGYALNEAGKFGMQANILNKALNDSLYYSLGRPGSMLRAVDNPFTREYGEPVVEVREPFQRMHYISSFSHILTNQIRENISDVATTVTAYSDGKYPVTVALDKAAPAERQVEKVVETGIFYDNVVGSGITGILHPLFHPLETARGVIKHATGVPDELMAKRIALAHLKESLQDIYGGELILVGNPDIRPHDLVYLADVYERMYGLFEVEQVVHHFTPELGFITTITPNALVTVNDPSRWYMTSWIHSWFSTQNMRNRSRVYIESAMSNNAAAGSGGVVSLDAIYQTLEPEMVGSIQYTHGHSALAKDIVSMDLAANNPATATVAAAGSAAVGVGTGAVAGVATAAFATGGVAAAVGGFLAFPAAALAWKGWRWIRDNVLDQHGCYIQYLNRNGQPMDAGLSYNQGMAVGSFHSKSLLPGLLGVRSKVRTPESYDIIRSDDLLKSLGWREVQIDTLVRYVSFENAQVHSRVLGLSGLGPERATLDRYFRALVAVTRFIDGDTIEVADIITNSTYRVRFQGIDTAELTRYNGNLGSADSIGGQEADNIININTPGGRALLYTSNALRNKVFVLRVNPTRSKDFSIIAEQDFEAGSALNTAASYQKDKFERVLGTIFYQTSEENRQKTITYVSSIFRREFQSENFKQKVQEDLYPDSVFAIKFDEIYNAVERTVTLDTFKEFLPLFAEADSGSELASDTLFIALQKDENKVIFGVLVIFKILETIYDKASDWPLVLWDDYYDDGSPVSLNWELVVNGLARVYTGDLQTLSPSAEFDG